MHPDIEKEMVEAELDLAQEYADFLKHPFHVKLLAHSRFAQKQCIAKGDAAETLENILEQRAQRQQWEALDRGDLYRDAHARALDSIHEHFWQRQDQYDANARAEALQGQALLAGGMYRGGSGTEGSLLRDPFDA